MMGAMIATTAASMAGVAQAIPAWSRPPTIAVLGVLLGSSFTQEMVGRMPEWLPSLATLPVYILVIGALALVYLRKVARIDPLTAFFCATPGGLGEMAILGDRAGGDLRTISLVHATRILLIVLTVPLTFRLLGYLPPGLSTAPPGGIELQDLAVLAVCGAAGIYGGQRLGLPAAGLLGPMLLSAAAHLLGLVEGSPPAWLVAAAQVVIGSSIGVRFEGYPAARVAWMMLVGLGLTVLMLSVTLMFGAGLQAVTGLPLPLLVLAFVPGGLAEMSLVALALTDDPAFVATNHIVRIGLVVLFASWLFRLYRRRLAPPSG
jgi:membrane AbrB-like protein